MNSQTDLMPRESQPLVAQENPGDIMAIIARASTTAGLRVEVMNGLMAIRREMMAEKAKRDFDDAMAKFQDECPAVIKTTRVQNAYSYAKFEDIIPVVKECEHRNGFHHALDVRPAADGWVTGVCVVTHVGGHSKEFICPLPIGKGTALMSNTQVYAAAQSFALRRAFCNAFGIVPTGEDHDGQASRPKPPGPRQERPATPTPSEPPKPAVAPPVRTRNAILLDIREAGTPQHRWKKEDGEMAWKVEKPNFEQWIVDECGIDKPLSQQTETELERTLVAVQNKLQKPLL